VIISCYENMGESFAAVVGIPGRHLQVAGAAWLRDASKCTG